MSGRVKGDELGPLRPEGAVEERVRPGPLHADVLGRDGLGVLVPEPEVVVVDLVEPERLARRGRAEVEGPGLLFHDGGHPLARGLDGPLVDVAADPPTAELLGRPDGRPRADEAVEDEVAGVRGRLDGPAQEGGGLLGRVLDAPLHPAGVGPDGLEHLPLVRPVVEVAHLAPGGPFLRVPEVQLPAVDGRVHLLGGAVGPDALGRRPGAPPVELAARVGPLVRAVVELEATPPLLTGVPRLVPDDGAVRHLDQAVLLERRLGQGDGHVLPVVDHPVAVLGVPKDGVVDPPQPRFGVVVGVRPLPDDLVLEVRAPEHLVHQAPELVAPVPVAVEPQAPVVGEELAEEQEPLVHELEVRVVGPDVLVLDLFGERVGAPLEAAPGAPQRDLAHVVGPGVERGVDVDEVHRAPVPVREEPGERLLVVAVEEQVAPRLVETGGGDGEGLGAVARGVEVAREPGGKRPDALERLFADPLEKGPALRFLDGDGLGPRGRRATGRGWGRGRSVAHAGSTVGAATSASRAVKASTVARSPSGTRPPEANRTS